MYTYVSQFDLINIILVVCQTSILLVFISPLRWFFFCESNEYLWELVSAMLGTSLSGVSLYIPGVSICISSTLSTWESMRGELGLVFVCTGTDTVHISPFFYPWGGVMWTHPPPLSYH